MPSFQCEQTAFEEIENQWNLNYLVGICIYLMSIVKRMSKLVFRELEGDLFSAPKTYSLAHCVAADLKMGAGIAVAFRDKFGQIAKLKEQGQKAGGLAVLEDQSRFIYYLISKNDTYKKPTYQDLFLSLHAMKKHMVRMCASLKFMNNKKSIDNVRSRGKQLICCKPGTVVYQFKKS